MESLRCGEEREGEEMKTREQERMEMLEQTIADRDTEIAGLQLTIGVLRVTLAQSGNYIADKEVAPTEVTFANGRTVRIVNGAMEIDRVKP